MRELLLLFLNQEFTKGPPVPLALEDPEGYKHPQPAAQSGGFPLKKRDCQEGRKPVGESRGMHVESPKKGKSSSLIPAESGTKTSKIRKLLLLGLTHREIADLVTRGNRGFVWNVYKRMRDEGLLPASRTATVSIPEPDYTFNRSFGVEIEACNCPRETLTNALREAGILVEMGSRNASTDSHWKLTTDGSLYGNDTFELVSPILCGEQGLDELEKVCWVLDAYGVKINNTCGVHVHFDTNDFNLTTWQNLILSYKHAETEIDKFMPASRRENRNAYCGSLRGFSYESIRSAGSIESLQRLFNSRYMKVNLEAYSRHGTVEFRQHSGTINFTKIENWVRFLGRMIIFASTASLPAGIRLEDFPFLGEKQKLYYKLRTKKLMV